MLPVTPKMSVYSVLPGLGLGLRKAGNAPRLASEARNKSIFYWPSGLTNIWNQHRIWRKKLTEKIWWFWKCVPVLSEQYKRKSVQRTVRPTGNRWNAQFTAVCGRSNLPRGRVALEEISEADRRGQLPVIAPKQREEINAVFDSSINFLFEFSINFLFDFSINFLFDSSISFLFDSSI